MGSAVRPTDETDPSSAPLSAEAIDLLPDELKAELRQRTGPLWTRGFAFAPEQHGVAELRDGCDFATVDYTQLSAPVGLALQYVAGGTVPNETVSYQVTGVDANGETTAHAATTLATGAIGSVKLTWHSLADNATYKVYGRVGGAIGLLATVGPFDPANPPTWTDTGVAVPGAAPPVSNTTGGPGVYNNLPIRYNIPYLVVTEDTCSSFGWQERDFKGRATRWNDNALPRALEAEFWSGLLAQAKGYPNDYLCNTATNTDLTPIGGPPTVARGMQILQDALQQTGFGGQGMIHVQAQTAPNLLGARRVGNLLLDIFDNIIVPGVGYPGTGPGNAAPAAGTAWMYATDLVMVRAEEEAEVFPDTFSEALDRGQAGFPNSLTFRAERFASAYWDGAAHYSCRVTLAV